MTNIDSSKKHLLTILQRYLNLQDPISCQLMHESGAVIGTLDTTIIALDLHTLRVTDLEATLRGSKHIYINLLLSLPLQNETSSSSNAKTWSKPNRL